MGLHKPEVRQGGKDLGQVGSLAPYECVEGWAREGLARYLQLVRPMRYQYV